MGRPNMNASAPLTSMPCRRRSTIMWAASAGRQSRFNATAIGDCAHCLSTLNSARRSTPTGCDGLDAEEVTVADLASIPMLTKAEAQGRWDAIVTTPDLNRQEAERILTEQSWFSYTRHDEQVFSSGGSSGVRGVYVWDWQFFVTIACLAWRMQARDERRSEPVPNARLAVLTAGVPPHASTPLFDVPTTAGMVTEVIEAGAPFDEVLAAVQKFAPTHLVGYASVIGRLARASLAGDLRIRAVAGEHQLRTALARRPGCDRQCLARHLA